MWALIFPFISPRSVLITIAGMCIAAGVYFATDYIHDKTAAEAAVVQLQGVVKAKEEAVRILTQAALQRNAAQATADAARVQLAILQTSYDEIIRKVDQSNAEEDGQIAPVLRDVLNSLGGMRPEDSGQ